VLLFRFLNNPLGDDMIGVFPEPAFLAGKFLEMPFGRFRAALLQTPAQRMMPLAVSLNLLSAKGLPLRVKGEVKVKTGRFPAAFSRP